MGGSKVEEDKVDERDDTTISERVRGRDRDMYSRGVHRRGRDNIAPHNRLLRDNVRVVRDT